MLRLVLKSKIHRATVTDTCVDYEGSITIDRGLMDAAGMVPYEQLRVANVTNGERFETYVIAGEAGSGTICVNGAAAHKVSKGDLLIIFQYVLVDPGELTGHRPRIVRVDARNRIVGQ